MDCLGFVADIYYAFYGLVYAYGTEISSFRKLLQNNPKSCLADVG